MCSGALRNQSFLLFVNLTAKLVFWVVFNADWWKQCACRCSKNCRKEHTCALLTDQACDRQRWLNCLTWHAFFSLSHILDLQGEPNIKLGLKTLVTCTMCCKKIQHEKCCDCKSLKRKKSTTNVSFQRFRNTKILTIVKFFVSHSKNWITILFLFSKRLTNPKKGSTVGHKNFKHVIALHAKPTASLWI